MTLWELGKDQKAQITKSTNEELGALNLKSLGFSPNKDVICLQTTFFGGPRVYQVGDHVFSLSKEIAQCIFIQPSLSTATHKNFHPLTQDLETAHSKI